MSLEEARYPSASNNPSTDVSSRLARPSNEGVSFPMCEAEPVLPVTNQPPKRRLKASL